MATSDKAKAAPAKETPVAAKTTTEAAPAKAADATPAKAEGGDKPASYSRGEGQKPVTQAYKDNWNSIFGKKTAPKKKAAAKTKPVKKKAAKKTKKSTKTKARKKR